MRFVSIQQCLRQRILAGLAAGSIFMANISAIAGIGGSSSSSRSGGYTPAPARSYSPTPSRTYTPPPSYSPAPRQSTPTPAPKAEPSRPSSNSRQANAPSGERRQPTYKERGELPKAGKPALSPSLPEAIADKKAARNEARTPQPLVSQSRESEQNPQKKAIQNVLAPSLKAAAQKDSPNRFYAEPIQRGVPVPLQKVFSQPVKTLKKTEYGSVPLHNLVLPFFLGYIFGNSPSSFPNSFYNNNDNRQINAFIQQLDQDNQTPIQTQLPSIEEQIAENDGNNFTNEIPQPEPADLANKYHVRRIVGTLETVVSELQHQNSDKLTHKQRLYLYWILLGGSEKNLNEVLGTAYSPVNPVSIMAPQSGEGLVIMMNLGANKQQEFKFLKLSSENLGELRNYFPLDRKEQGGDIIRIPKAMSLSMAEGHSTCKVSPHGSLQVIERKEKSLFVKYLPPKRSRKNDCAFGAELILPHDKGTKMNLAYLQNLLEGHFGKSPAGASKAPTGNQFPPTP